MAEELAIQPHIVELVLGHEFRAGVQKTYNRARYAREIRDAYLRWHDPLGRRTRAETFRHQGSKALNPTAIPGKRRGRSICCGLNPYAATTSADCGCC
jgi:hypothetical protein